MKQKRKKIRKRNTGKFIFIIIALILLIGVLKVKSVINDPLKISNEEVVTVENGESFYTIINRLKNENKIKSPFIIKMYSKLAGLNLEVVPGSHTLKDKMSIKEMVETLRDSSNAIAVTIPEGFNIEDIASRLQEQNICTSEEFINAVKSYPLPSYVKDNSEKRYNLEGFLFPDTYKFEAGVEPQYIIKTMINRFEEVFKQITANTSINENDVEKMVNVASIIEKEARVDEDRPLIASVIYNRINQNMPLQIDATVIYAHGYYIESVRNRHLAIESKYNTYLYKGLPVGPICNPGIESLKAAFNPASTDYLFYLLAGENKHYFTNNYNDFLKKKEELGY